MIKSYIQKSLLICFFLLSLFNNYIKAQQSDNEDGTYTNPVIPADFPDPDVIRVDSMYYMVSTTMFIFPGVTILKSKDLVNWEYCSNAVQRMDFSPCYNLDGCNRYSHGQWATSLRYHNGKYYLMFIALDDGGFICTADQPEGPWEIKKLERGFYDPGLFFDDDGKIYVAHGIDDIYMTELDTSFAPKGEDKHVFTGDLRDGLEGCHVYKINGYYYLYATYGGGDGFQVALRSENIYGPYEQKVVIKDRTPGVNFGIHQGALIQTQTGEWWTMLFTDRGPFGRFPSLQPVTWVDDWPMVGVDGKGVVTYPKPDVGKSYPPKILPASSEFENDELGMQWGWNHNPDSTKWSLTDNQGYLRLSTAKVVSELPEARNTLTQRIFSYYSQEVYSAATTKIRLDHMQEGDVAGLAVFQDPYAYIGIKKTDGKHHLIMVNDGSTVDSAPIEDSIIYLRALAHYGTGEASFAYSFDNKSFASFGNTLDMEFNLDVFTGNKFCLFNYPTLETGGYVDIDWFRTDSIHQKIVNSERYTAPKYVSSNVLSDSSCQIILNQFVSITSFPPGLKIKINDTENVRISDISQPEEDSSLLYIALDTSINTGDKLTVSYQMPGGIANAAGNHLRSFVDLQVNDTIHVVPPKVKHIETTNYGDTIWVNFDLTMKSPALFNRDFIVKINGSKNISVRKARLSADDYSVIGLILSDRISHEDNVTLSYTGSDYKATNEARLPQFSSKTVQNNVYQIPELKKLETKNKGDTIWLYVNLEMNSPAPFSADFTVHSVGKENISVTDAHLAANDSSIILIPEKRIFYEDSVTLSYSGTGLKSKNGARFPKFSTKPIVNKAYGYPLEIVSTSIRKAEENYKFIDVKFDKILYDTTFNKEAFTVKINDEPATIISLSAEYDSITFSIHPSIQYEDTITISYSGGHVRSRYNGILKNFMDYKVINTIPMPNTSINIQSNSLQENNIEVFPNPAESSLQVSWNNNFYTLEIMNLSGVTVSHRKFDNSINKTNISLNLSPGIYILKVSNDKKSAITRIILK